MITIENVSFIKLFYNLLFNFKYIIIFLFDVFVFYHIFIFILFSYRLIFSQSLFTLDLIQDFLENAEDIEDINSPYGRSWIQGQDFFRIDGSVSPKVREDCCEQFNDVTNSKYFYLNIIINIYCNIKIIYFQIATFTIVY